MRSDIIKKGTQRAPHRSLLRATGQITDDRDFDKPFIAICNSYLDIIPGHVHLQAVGEYVKQCVREAGGVPFLFNTIGVDDGIAMGHVGMKLLAAQPRADRRLRRDHAPGPLLRRHDLHSQLRQDRARACSWPPCASTSPRSSSAAGPWRRDGRPAAKTIDLIDVFVGAAARQQGKISDGRADRVGDSSAVRPAAPAAACSRPTP